MTPLSEKDQAILEKLIEVFVSGSNPDKEFINKMLDLADDSRAVTLAMVDFTLSCVQKS